MKTSKNQRIDVLENQHNIFLFICNFYEKYGYAPSMQQISEGQHMSKATVHFYMERLRYKGLLIQKEGERQLARAYRPKGFKVVRE